MLRALTLVLIWLCLAPMSFAQSPPAILIADNVRLEADDTLVATGNVEVFQNGVTVKAPRITYNQRKDSLIIDGPLSVKDGTKTTILATQAELDSVLFTGILRSARMVINEQLQFAAVQIDRIDTRYSQLYKVAATSCRICEEGQLPLWHIRAKRVVHDKEERQLYFDHATLRVGPVPILYLPRLRLPDPTVERATGFLIPRLRSNSQLGLGINIPYFIRLGDHKDLTLRPYLSSETRTLEARYRQAFRTGRITFDGAVSRDTLLPDEDRFYVMGGGSFGVGRGYVLRFDVEVASDNAYLAQYGYSFKSRLDSQIALSRTRRDEYILGSAIVYHSLRTDEIQSQLPTLVLDGNFERRYFPKTLGGELRLSLAAHGHQRTSRSPVSGAGRDVARLQADLFWLRSWHGMHGVQADAKVGVALQVFETRQDDVFAGSQTQAIPQASLALRYPLRKTTQNGTLHYLEPVVQLAWTGGAPANVPDDESRSVEFDEGNLLALSRFPEADRREHGSVLAVGLNWARYDPNGWESYIAVGQLIRDDAHPDFNATSGLDGARSDTLISGILRSQSGLALAGRALFDSEFNFSKAEMRADYTRGKGKLGAGYVWLDEDSDENRNRAVSELTVNGQYLVARHWNFSGLWRYDLEDDRSSWAGLGLEYTNECVTLNFDVFRRFATSTVVEPSTTLSLSIGLSGFSAKSGTESTKRTCSSPAS
ncbi:MAG: LPS-assembly protein LptD [Paracoccaceae bacterium]